MELPPIPLPLPPYGPPPGYDWADRDMSNMSSTTAFRTGLNRRDKFFGNRRCVVCGETNIEHCHVIMQAEVDVWSDLRDRHWVPNEAKDEPAHEPRNGLTLCHNHHYAFDHFQFFIRYLSEPRVFVFINYSGHPTFNQFDGKAIAIDIDDQHAPFPSIFIIHEMLVRAKNPFRPINPNVPDPIMFQDWIYSDNVLDNPGLSNNYQLFKRDRPNDDDDGNGSTNDENGDGGGADNDNNNDSNIRDMPRRSGRIRNTRQQAMTAGTSSATQKLQLNPGVIADILAATHAMPSWRACQMENMSWSGTADENMRRYLSLIGVEKSLSSNAAERENTTRSGTADENMQRYVSLIGIEDSLSSNAAERTGTSPQELESQLAGVTGKTHLGKMISRDDVPEALALLVDREDAAGLAIDIAGGDEPIKALDAVIKKGETDFLG